MGKEFFNEQEMALRPGCSVAWLRKRRMAGGGPKFVKMGKLVRYSASDADDYINGLLRMDSTSAVTVAGTR